MKLTKKIIKASEVAAPNITINDEGDYYLIQVDNSCGEDFSFEINKGENEIEEIISYCEDFDIGEHFKLWYGANRGEPSDPVELMDNCKEIADNLESLRFWLSDYILNH